MSEEAPSVPTGKRTASETARSLERALDILEAVSERPLKLVELARRVGLGTTTCYRLAKVLADRGLLSTSGRTGYRLGPRAGEIGEAFKRQMHEQGSS